MRLNERGAVPFKLIALLVVAIAVFAGVVGALTVRVPDANTPGPTSVGYFDTKATVVWAQFGHCYLTDSTDIRPDGTTQFTPAGTGCEVSPYAAGTAYNPRVEFDEHLTMPTAPASFISFPAATISTTCTSFANMIVIGPNQNDFDPSAKRSENIQFTLGNAATYRWGHYYVNTQGSFDVRIELWVGQCYGYQEPEKVETLYRTLEFDGEADA